MPRGRKYGSKRSTYDRYWDEQGTQYLANSRAQGRTREPCSYPVGNGSLLCAALVDITAEWLFWLSSLHTDEGSGHIRGLVISCLGEVQWSVREACESVGWVFMNFHIGYNPARNRQLREVLLAGEKFLERGAPVIVHCLAGVHRAALAFCLCLMFYLGISFAVARTFSKACATLTLTA